MVTRIIQLLSISISLLLLMASLSPPLPLSASLEFQNNLSLLVISIYFMFIAIVAQQYKNNPDEFNMSKIVSFVFLGLFNISVAGVVTIHELITPEFEEMFIDFDLSLSTITTSVLDGYYICLIYLLMVFSIIKEYLIKDKKITLIINVFLLFLVPLFYQYIAYALFSPLITLMKAL